MIIIFFWIIFAMIPAFVAKGKGNSFILFLLISLVLSPIVGLIIALLVPGKTVTNQGIQIQAPPSNQIADELKKLSDLRSEGIITDEEFSKKKAEMMG